MQEITFDTKIADLLKIEGMKDFLITINPKFKKLNNPILRRTIAKVAGIKQAAIVGGMKPIELLNKIREFVGQKPIDKVSEQIELHNQKPDWLKKEAAQINANELLDDDKNPLVESLKILKNLQKEEVLKLTADFRPEPLIEEFIKKGYEIYVEEKDNLFLTYIKK
jgi:hypothetical protein